MRRESHVRICERLGAKFPGPTRRRVRLVAMADYDLIRRSIGSAASGLEHIEQPVRAKNGIEPRFGNFLAGVARRKLLG
jgi:hypothetical protein